LYDDGHTGIFSANALDNWNDVLRTAQEMGVPRAIQPRPASSQN
jgi:hypothetical protein